MLAVGTLLQNRYRVARQLGKGGMGAVYRGWDTRLNIPVAIKEMLPQPGLDPYLLSQLQAQFEQEAGTLARLNHPNLVRVTDFFEENENAYLIMDFVEGDSLADRIAEVGQLPEEQVLIWARQLLDALAYLHNQKFIHRDVKPQNVVIRANGQAVLVDFGLVKLWDPNDPHTKTAMRGLGTPEYAPPEQYGDPSAGHTDPRSDLYSLAATLYHALTGKIPPTATQRIVNPAAMQPIKKIIPNIQESTQEAIAKALELQPTARYQNAQEMMEILCADIPFITTGSLKTLPQKSKSQPVEPVNGETPPITSSGKPGSRTITTPGVRQTPAPMPPQSITLPPMPQDSLAVVENQPPVTPAPIPPVKLPERELPAAISSTPPISQKSEPWQDPVKQPILPVIPVTPAPAPHPEPQQYQQKPAKQQPAKKTGSEPRIDEKSRFQEYPDVPLMPLTEPPTLSGEEDGKIKTPIKNMRELPPPVWIIIGVTLTLCMCCAALYWIGAKTEGITTPTPVVTATAITVEPEPTATTTVDQLSLALEWPVVFTDTFDNNDNNWDVGESSTGLLEGNKYIEGGKFLWEITAVKGFVWRSHPEGTSARDFYVEVTGRKIAGQEDGYYGIAFRRVDNENFYVFYISDDQQFKCSKLQNNEWDPLIKGDYTETIKPGQENKLAIIAEGGQFMLFINDQHVTTVSDSTYSEGDIGVLVGLNKAEDTGNFEFDNFTLRRKP